MSEQLKARIAAKGRKRILSLDGGGIRGAVTLGFLVRMEAFLTERHPHIPDFRLRDYFDLIGGTSTGSIIAASLALGMKATEIREAYMEMGGEIFERPARWYQMGRLLRQNLFYKNKPKAIEATLRNYYGDRTMASEELTTALCIVTKRADTGSTWPFHNNPSGKYYKYADKLPLWRVVRASSAAPTYFPPLSLDYGNGVGEFIDGGVSMFNNPSLQLLQMAAAKGYRYHWDLGEDKIMLVSVGTGTYELKPDPVDIQKMGKANALFWGMKVPQMFMRDSNDLNQIILQAMSNSPTAREIDREIGNLENDYFMGGKQLHYVRYNAFFDAEAIAVCAQNTSRDGQKYPSIRDLNHLTSMDKGPHVHHLLHLGTLAAEKAISKANFPIHFPEKFDQANRG